MSTRMIRGRVRAGRIEPIEDVELPEGAEVSFSIDEPEIGTGQAIVAALRRAPRPEPGAVEELRRAIADGRGPTRVAGVFDEPEKE